MSQSDMYELDKAIRKLTVSLPESRPFLSEGSPLDCQVFLVGINPATDTDFWKHWSKVSGCNKSSWLDDYLQKHGKYSPTRKRIEIFCKSVAPLKVLETNIFASPSSREAELKREKRDTSLFDYLVEVIRPKILIGHGKSVIEHLSKRTGKSLMRGQYSVIKVGGVHMDVRVENHFSYQWSEKAIEIFGEEIKGRYA